MLIVGAGGLGCPSALYLAGAGVGHIGIVDYDDIEITNLHRQLLYSTLDIGMSKVGAAAESLQRYSSSMNFFTLFIKEKEHSFHKFSFLQVE